MKNSKGSPETVFKAIISLLVILLISVGVYIYNPLSLTATTVYTQPTVSQGQKQVVGDLTIVNLHGTPYEVGYQHGELLKTEIHSLLDVMDDILRTNGSLQRILKDGYLNYVTRTYFQYIPEKYRLEMKGIADGAGVLLQDVILINIYDDLFNLNQCTNISVWGDYTQNGEIVHGRNLDYNLAHSLWNRQVVLVYAVQNQQQVVSVGWPGFIGILTGMNEAGLSLGSMTSEIKYDTIFGVPSGILYREIMESAKNIQQVEEILVSSRRTIGNNLMVTSRQDGKGTVFEFTPRWLVSRSDYITDMVAAANHFELIREENENEESSESRYRQHQAERLAHYYQNSTTPLNLIEMIGILDDRLVEEDGVRPIANGMNIQSVVFLPMREEIWISINDVVPAASGIFWGFKFNSTAKNPLQYIGQTMVSDSYFASQHWFHRNNLDYWTDLKINQVIARFEQKELETIHVLKEEAYFYLQIGKFDQAIQLYHQLLPLVGDGQWIRNGKNVYYLRPYMVELELALAHKGNNDFIIAREILENIILQDAPEEYILDRVTAELNKIDKELGL